MKDKESKSFTKLYDPLWKQSRLYNFIIKGLTEGQIYHKDSVSKLLFLFEVIVCVYKNFIPRELLLYLKHAKTWRLSQPLRTT